MPVRRRSTAGASTSRERHRRERRGPCGRAAARRRAPRRAARASSTSVFHSPQPGQRPCHFGLSWPQAEQVKTVAERAMRRG